MTQRADSTQHTNDARIHTVDGRYIRCCERGETDCPCICHDHDTAEEPK